MRTIFLSFLLFISSGLFAQIDKCPDAKEDCGSFQLFIKAAQAAASGNQPKYDEAITQYNAARVCCPSATATIDSLIIVVFKMIEKQRDVALKAEKRAVNAEKKAKASLEKANKLISYFDFTPTRTRAWAYQNGKFAVIDKNGDRRTPFIYDDPDTFQTNGYALARKGKFQLLIDSAGNPSIEYESLFPANNGWYKAKKGKNYSLVDYSGRQLPGLDWYESIDNFSSGLAAVRKDNTFGFIDSNGKLAIPFQYSSAVEFQGDVAWARHPKKGWGLINRQGAFIIEPEYSTAKFILPGISYASIKGMFGVVDTSGQYVLKPEYDDIRSFNDGMASVIQDGKFGYINAKGELVISPRFLSASNFSKGFAIVTLDSMRQFINRNGTLLFSRKFEEAYNFKNGLAAVKEKKEDKWGFIDTSGVFRIPPQFDFVESFSNGVAWIKLDKKKWGLIDTTGKVISETTFDEHRVRNFYDYPLYNYDYNNDYDITTELPSENLFAVRKDTFWGFVGIDGKIKIPLIFKEVADFQNGFAAVQQNGKWGFVDKNNKMAIQPIYTSVNSFSEGLVAVQKENDGKWGFLDQTGAQVFPFEYDAVTDFYKGVARVRKGDKWGLVSKKRGIVKEAQYSQINIFSEGLALVSNYDPKLNSNICGFIDTLGNEVIPLQFRSGGDFHEGFVWVTLDSSEGYIDRKGNFIFQIPVESARNWYPQEGRYYYSEGNLAFSNGLAIVKMKGKWGLIDKNGRWKIPARYDYAFQLGQGIIKTQEETEKVLLDDKGNRIAKVEYNFQTSNIKLAGKLGKFRDPYGNLLGFLDPETGNVLGPFSATGNFSNGVAWVSSRDESDNYNYNWGLLDETGHMLISPRYISALEFKTDITWANNNNIWGLIDKKGNFKPMPEISAVHPFSENLSRVEKNDQIGYVDTSGRFVIPCQFELPYESSSPYYTDYPSNYVRPRPLTYNTGLSDYSYRDFNLNNFKGYKGYVGTNNYSYDIRYRNDYDLNRFDFLQNNGESGDFHSGRAPLWKDSKWGYIDVTGAFIIKPEYDAAANFSEGLAWVVKGRERKLLQQDGTEVPLKRPYDIACPFNNGFAIVTADEQFGMIDKTGSEVIPVEYEALAPFSEGLAAARKDGKWGYVDEHGKEIIRPQFEGVYDFENGKAEVEKEGETFFINKRGQLIIVDESISNPIRIIPDDSRPYSEDH